MRAAEKYTRLVVERRNYYSHAKGSLVRLSAGLFMSDRLHTDDLVTSRLEAIPTMSEQRCIDLPREKKVANGMGFEC